MARRKHKTSTTENVFTSLAMSLVIASSAVLLSYLFFAFCHWDIWPSDKDLQKFVSMMMRLAFAIIFTWVMLVRLFVRPR